MKDLDRLNHATAHLDPPLAVVDLAALRENAADLVRRANGKPIRVASKSVRCREILRAVLEMDGFEGVMAFTLPEALWLAESGFSDILVAYPTADRAALRRLSADPVAADVITLTADSVEQLDLIEKVMAEVPDAAPVRISVDIDASWRPLRGKLRVGARRSPLHSVEAVSTVAREAADRTGLRLVGLMAYEAQIAGVGDRPPGRPARGLARVRAMQGLSAAELAERRAEIVAAVKEIAQLEFVNGGGTGSMERTAAEEAVTEIAAGLRAVQAAPVRRLPERGRPPGGAVRAAGGAPPGARRGDRARRRIRGLRHARQGPAAAAVPAEEAALRPAGGRGRGADPAARPDGGRPGRGRPGLVPAREGRRAVRALRRAAHGRGDKVRRPCRRTAARGGRSSQFAVTALTAVSRDAGDAMR